MKISRVITGRCDAIILDRRCWVYSFTGGAVRIPEMTGVLASIPIDPLNSCTWSGNATCRSRYGNTHQYCACHPVMGGYSYAYEHIQTGAIPRFNMTTRLENPKDPDRCEVTLNVITIWWATCNAWSWSVSYPSAVDTNTRKTFYITLVRP